MGTSNIFVGGKELANYTSSTDKLSLDSGVDLGLTANHAGVKTALNASGNMPIYACRAWVNFNGTGTVAIRASGNVSSITDIGTGDYEVNFTTAMSDSNYSVSVSQPPHNYTQGNRNLLIHVEENSAYPTASINIRSGTIANGSSGGSVLDFNLISIAIFRWKLKYRYIWIKE